MAELKLCPSCKGKAHRIDDYKNCQSMVKCSLCWVRTDWRKSIESAEEEWNNRPDGGSS